MSINPFSDFTTPVPNGPFYSPLMTSLQGPYYDWAADASSGFNFATGTFSGGGGGGGYASTTTPGIVTLSTDAATIAGTDSTLAVTPSTLQAKVSSTTATGLIRIATTAEAAAGLDNTVALTPLNIGSRAATKTTTGFIQLATSAETITGTDDTKAVTPADLTARVATTSATGIVQLVDSITSTSTTTAATANSVRLSIDASILKATLTGKGSLVSASAATTPLELAVGTDGDFLTVDSTATTGLAWTNTINGGTY